MRTLLVIIALGEAVTGLFLFAAPGLALHLLFGSEASASAVVMIRVAGIVLVALGIACYPRGSRQGLWGLLIYSVLITLYLITVGMGGMAGVLLWPIVILHALLAVVLIVALRAPAAQHG